VIPSADSATVQFVLLVAIGVFFGILFVYIALVVYKSRVSGFRGDHMRVVDSIALSQTSRIALVEVYHGDLYLVAVNEARVSLLDKVTSAEVVERVRYPRGRPATGGS
jgi:flagellar biogenesis protein FliO